MKTNRTNTRMAYAVAATAMLSIFSCSKENTPSAIPTQSEIEKGIVGKWSIAVDDGKTKLTNENNIRTFNSDGTGSISIARQLQSDTQAYNAWLVKLPLTYKVEGNVLAFTAVGPTTQIPVTAKQEVIGLDANEVRFHLQEVDATGETSATINKQILCKRITKDYSNDILGLWKGISSSNGAFGDENHYWAYLDDGTYLYFSQDAQGKWATRPYEVTNYLVDGNWLATRWSNEDGVNFECWDIDDISNNRMKWSAVRETADGGRENASFEMERMVPDVSTGIAAELAGNRWVSNALFLNNKQVSQEELLSKLHLAESKDTHIPIYFSVNKNATLSSNIDGAVRHFIWDVDKEKNHLKILASTGAQAEMSYDKEADMVAVDASLAPEGYNVKMICKNTAFNIADIKQKIQGKWGALMLSTDGKVSSVDEIVNSTDLKNGVLPSTIQFTGDKFIVNNYGHEFTGDISLSPNGMVFIKSQAEGGEQRALSYRPLFDILQLMNFEMNGKVYTILYQRMDADQPAEADLIGTWNTDVAYNGAIILNTTFAKNIKKMLPEVELLDTSVDITFSDASHGNIHALGTDMPFTYSVEDGEAMVKINVVNDNHIVMWFNKYNSKLYFNGVGPASNRNAVISLTKKK